MSQSATTSSTATGQSGAAARGPATVYPFMSYRDAPAAIEWLCRAFGFEKQLVVPGENGTIAHAQLRLGNGMIMLGTAAGQRETFGMGLPRDLGAVTGGAYLVVDDIDAHCARAKAAGAEFVRDLAATDYGSHEYMVRDPEGHLWSIGTYQPFSDG